MNNLGDSLAYETGASGGQGFQREPIHNSSALEAAAQGGGSCFKRTHISGRLVAAFLDPGESEQEVWRLEDADACVDK